MSKLTRWTIGIVTPLCIVAIAMAQFGNAKASETGSNLKTYRDVDGQTYFALALRPEVEPVQQKNRDILVLVDTSASQTGLFREDTLEAVRSLAGGLRAGERVNIMAIDLKVVPMTKGFVAPGSKALAKGLVRLKSRTPLGATDLVGGLNTAAKLFEDNGNARSIVYIGDGMSRANAMAFDELDPLVQKLAANRISINSYAIGLRRDIDLLAVLANNSGGSLFLDGPGISAQDAGSATLQLARGTVVWPTNVEWSSSITQSFPARMPPLRYDRDTVLIGTLVGKKAVDLTINAEIAGKARTITHSIQPQDTSDIDDLAMVPELVAMSRKTDGIMMPLLGSQGLDQARRSFQAASENLSKLGKQALTRGDVNGGIELLREALRRDPGNAEAKALLNSNTAVRATSTKGIVAQVEEDPFGDLGGDEDPFGDLGGDEDPFGDAGGDDPFGGDDTTDDNPLEIEDEEPVLEPAETDPVPAEVLPEEPTEVPEDLTLTPAEEPSTTPTPAVEATPEPVELPPVVDYGYGESPLVLNGDEPKSDRDLLLNAEEERLLQEEMLRVEVTRSLSAGRDAMRRDPAGVLDSLKNLRETIVQAPNLSSSVRAGLLGRLEVGLREASRARIEKDKLDEIARANLAELDARRRLLDADARTNQKVRQYLDQINALIDEGRFELAEEVALQMREEAPNRVEPMVALTEAGHLGNYKRMRDLAELSARRWNDALYQVELSHIPFPDDPPIEYPPAEEWGPLSERRKAQYSKFDLGETGPAERRISSALQNNLTSPLQYEETPLGEVIAIIREDYNIPIQFDRQALQDETVDETADTVSIDVSNISLRSALRLMLKELNLTYVIDNEVLMITSKDKAEETLVTKVYPVGDLVMPINSMGGMMGGGMMGGGMGGGMMGGGMGGGMMGGGMGGGMMGGGMMGGGMGGGMMGGGMGGGMMGGGGMGGGMFDVEDALTLKPKTTAAPSEAVATPATKVESQRITPVRKGSESVHAMWERHFAEMWNADVTKEQERQNFANVRETLRQLTAQKNFPEVVAVIAAALRNGQYQPVLHETLAVALQAMDANDDALERALMSTVDLSQNPDQILFVATQLSRLGLDARAMQLYRDVATSFPLRPEPYMHALDAAKRIKDRDGIQWACENILSQAWPEKHKHVFDKAVLTAKATLYDLDKAGKKAEYNALAETLNNALSRDCVVRVTWTGDADIDLLVEEPSGTVCSLRNARTSSGGVMLGDALPNPDDQTADGISETYICPKGFSGQYRVLVRRIWGDVAAGKVNVEIATNVQTDEAGTTTRQFIQKQIDVREKDAMLTFELQNGRREEAIEDNIVANAAVRHIEANRAILAQQFDRLADERVAASSSLAELELLTTRDPRSAARLQAALRGRGAVGFMPQLTVLPEGTMMLGQAVISADRRYVRVSMSPFFSRVADVQTFNFATGNAQNQGAAGGGAGGGGFGGGGAGGGFGGGGGF